MRLNLHFALYFLLGITLNSNAQQLQRLKYNNPGLAVDLHVGLWAWPVPVDYDQDGDLDLLISCPDVPYDGVYSFENPDGSASPVFKAPVRITDKIKNISPSYVNGQLKILVPGAEITLQENGSFSEPVKIYHQTKLEPENIKVRANQWKYVDYENDGDLDILVGHGIWTDYGWDNAFNEKGEWTNGPLHGYSYVIINSGTKDEPEFEKPFKIMAGNEPADVYGMPSPCMEDFDGDGDLDLICGEFVDSFTWFENIGTREEPEYTKGRKLESGGDIIRMDLEMMVVTSVDWDQDGDVDLIVGQEDGRVAFMENTGVVKKNMPVFKHPVFFKQEADDLIFGALTTPWSVDWDDDGDEDLISGNTAGYIGFIENLDGATPPKWAEPVYLEANGKPIRIMAGYNGSIQGPCEAKWGYTTLSVGDWDGDGLKDIVANSILGTVVWYKNFGSKGKPKMKEAQNVEVLWGNNAPKPAWNWRDSGKTELLTQWRTTPIVEDLNKDGVSDLIVLDHKGYLSFFEGKILNGRKMIQPGKRIFISEDNLVYDNGHKVTDDKSRELRLNPSIAGSSGRRKICFADWNNDGKPDLIVNSKPNVAWLENVTTKPGEFVFRKHDSLGDKQLAGHTTSPTKVDWNKDGIDDILIGAEDGCFYYLQNPATHKK